ncbi:MAG TPA: hypothetical protein PLD54_05030 [Candidatus Levybacteria bacterium]|nr:hypothetical protein [Candidatus Levybacteria bacterium]
MSERYRQLPIEELQDFITDEIKPIEDIHAEIEMRLSQQGIVFDHIPESLYPGMPYISSVRLSREKKTHYTRDYINKLSNRGEVPAHHIGEGWILDPEGVEVLLEREKQSLNRTSFPSPGRKPGSKGRKREK